MDSSIATEGILRQVLPQDFNTTIEMADAEEELRKGSNFQESSDNLNLGVCSKENLKPEEPTVRNQSFNQSFQNITLEDYDTDSSFSIPSRNHNLTCLADQLNNLHLGTPCPPKRNPFSSANTLFSNLDSCESSYTSAQSINESGTNLSVSEIEICNGLNNSSEQPFQGDLSVNKTPTWHTNSALNGSIEESTPVSTLFSVKSSISTENQVDDAPTRHTDSDSLTGSVEESISVNTFFSAKSSTESEFQTDDAVSSDLPEEIGRDEEKPTACNFNCSQATIKVDEPLNLTDEKVPIECVSQEEFTSKSPKLDTPVDILKVKSTQSEEQSSPSKETLRSEQAAVQQELSVEPEQLSKIEDQTSIPGEQSVCDPVQVGEFGKKSQQTEQIVSAPETVCQGEQVSKPENQSSPVNENIAPEQPGESKLLYDSEGIIQEGVISGEKGLKKQGEFSSPSQLRTGTNASPSRKSGILSEKQVSPLKQTTKSEEYTSPLRELKKQINSKEPFSSTEKELTSPPQLHIETDTSPSEKQVCQSKRTTKSEEHTSHFGEPHDQNNSKQLVSNSEELTSEIKADSNHCTVATESNLSSEKETGLSSELSPKERSDATTEPVTQFKKQHTVAEPDLPTETSESSKANPFEQSLELDAETVRSVELFKASKKKAVESSQLSLDSEKQEAPLDMFPEPEEFRNTSWNSEAGPVTAAEEIFCDPASFDFLAERGNNTISSNLYKKSLFVRFDPFVNPHSPGTIEKQLTASLKMADDNCSEEIHKSESKKSPSPVTPLKNPALEAVGKLIEASPSVPGVDRAALEADLANLKELLVQQEKEFKEKIQKMEKNEVKLRKEISDKSRNKEQMGAILQEYEETISQMVAQKEIWDEKIKAVENERDTTAQHLNNLEIAFNDVHQKYERCKAVIESLKQNEDVLKASVEEYDIAIKKQENKYEMLKQHAKSQLEKANQELEVRTKSQEAESAKLRALLKKAEIKSTSLEQALEQKTNENTELMKICDELINKVGSS